MTLRNGIDRGEGWIVHKGIRYDRAEFGALVTVARRQHHFMSYEELPQEVQEYLRN